MKSKGLLLFLASYSSNAFFISCFLSEIEISFQDVNGQDHTLIANGLLSVVVQHEMDHLEGSVFVDHLSRLKRDLSIKKTIKFQKNPTKENRLSRYNEQQ